MDRLTGNTRNFDGTGFAMESLVNDNGILTDFADKVLTKLADYEDAEEQELLLRLPCKVGDTVYAIPSWANFRLNKSFGHAEHNRVYPQIVDHIEFSSYGCRISTCDGRQGHGQEAFGETWFLTREEAEQALKQMGE